MKTNFSFSLSAIVVMLAVVLAFTPIGAMAQTQTRNYTDATGGFLNTTTFVPLAAHTTSGAGSAGVVDIGPYGVGVIHVDVTAVGGTGTLVVNFQVCTDSTTTYCSTLTSSASITATGSYNFKVDNFGRYVYVTYTIASFSSVTFQTVGVFKPLI